MGEPVRVGVSWGSDSELTLPVGLSQQNPRWRMTAARKKMQADKRLAFPNRTR